VALVSAAFAVLPACNSEKQSEAKHEATGDAGAPRPAGVDKNLAEAIGAVANDTSQGPPPNGLFAPGAADKEMKAGDPPKFSLGGKGTGETITFGGPAIKLPKPLAARADVSVRTGPQAAMPTIDFALLIDNEKPAEGADAPSAATAKVVGSKLGKEQPGQLPPELEKEVGKLKGGKVRFDLAPTGGARVSSVELSKESDENFGLAVQAAGNAVALAYLPFPTEPVGIGAYWLVTSRENYAGLDVVAYRMIKLEKVEGGKAVLTLSTKRMVAGGKLGLPGLPEHTLTEFSGSGTGQLVVPVATPGLVEQGLVTDSIGAGITVPNAPPGRDHLVAQLQMRTQFGVGTR